MYKLYINILIIIMYILGITLLNKYYLIMLFILLFLYSLYVLIFSIFEIKVIISFMLLYIYNFLQFLLFDKKLSVYLEYNKQENLYFVGMTMFLFTSLFFNELGIIDKNKFKIKSKHSNKILFINLLIIFYFMLTGVKGKIGNYREIEITTKIEYLILPYLMISFYTKKIYKEFLGFIYIIFSFYLLLIGSRVSAIQLIFMVIILNKRIFFYFMNNKGIIFIGIGIFVMKLVENIRNIKGDFYERINYFFTMEKSNVVVNNEADVIYSGAAIIGLIKNNIFSLKKSLQTLMGSFLDIFRIEYYKFPANNIAKQVQEYTSIGGGGIISANLYYLGREIAIIFIALFLANQIKKIFKDISRKEWKNIYSLVILITIFRWYAYSVSTIYKMGIYSLFFYYINKLIYLIDNKYFKNYYN